jgi:hypothetical protein
LKIVAYDLRPNPNHALLFRLLHSSLLCVQKKRGRTPHDAQQHDEYCRD